MALRPETPLRLRPLRSAWAGLAGALWLVAALGGGFVARASSIDAPFLKIEALTVDATDPNHDGWVNLLAFGDGSVRGPLLPPALGGAKASPPHFNDLTVRKFVDKSSPSLMLACASGKHFPRAQIDFVRESPSTPGEGVTYLKIILTDVMVSSYSFSGPSSSVPTELVSLNFTKFALDYTDQAITGSCRVTYDVGTADASFSTGPPVNHAPTLSLVPTKLGTSPQAIQFTVAVGDADSPPPALTLTGTSDNAALLPAGSITSTGTGAIRAVKLLPAVNASGLAHVTLSVSDGTASTSVFFLAIFNHPPPFPFLDLSNHSVPEHTPAGTPIGQFFTNPPGATGLTLLDSSAGRFRLELNQLLVNDPLLLDFETSPQPQITVCYFDASGLPFYAQFTLDVQDIPEGAFDLWRHQFFTPEELLDPLVAGPEADPEHDGRKNLFEYALCLPPRDGTDPDTSPHLGEIALGDKTYLTLTYRRRPPAFDPDLSVRPFISNNFHTWDCGASHFVVLSEVLLAPDCEEITVRAAAPKQDGVRQLVRLEVVR